MLIRYGKTEDGKHGARALVYLPEEHGIDGAKLDFDALRIVERLHENGHEAYIVGGAVRDLLLGRTPKDFDIVTDAEPARIKRIFRNARVIGRRFRLVHVYAGPKIFEVSTFRSIAKGTVGNEYGSIDEDARRRDFTCNALYFDPVSKRLVDFVGGFRHMKARRIVPVIPLKSIFVEDPVRMIRCLKYAATTGFAIPFGTRWAIRRDARLLADASPSRLTEEFLKILASGKAGAIVAALDSFGLLKYIVPGADAFLSSGQTARKDFFAALAELDGLDAAGLGRERRLSHLISHFIRPFLLSLPQAIADRHDAYHEALQQTRAFLAPLNLPRVELEAAVLMVFRKMGLSPLERPRRPGPERGHGLPERSGARGGRRPKAPSGEAAAEAPPPQEPREARSERPGGEPGDEGEAGKTSSGRKRRRRRGGSAKAGNGAEPAAEAPAGKTEGPARDGEGRSKTSGAARRRRKRMKKDSEGGSEA